MITIDKITEVLKGVVHPAQEKSILELSLIQRLAYDPETNTIKFRLVFKKQDPLSGAIKENCEEALKEAFPGVKVKILELIDSGGSTTKSKGTLGRSNLEHYELSKVENIIAIASGKGGVGKSTVAVNLAITLARKGFKVGLIDADIYGPSIPKMIGLEGAVPQMLEEADYMGTGETKQLIVPVEKYGVKWISIGFFVKPEQALIWRGPMASGALKQFAYETRWGELDYLLIDLPPGTGDIHISMIQDVALTGAIIVTTPQTIATVDVVKGINMFRNEKVDTPILGIVENMSWFTPAELPQNKYYIFGKDGGVRIAEEYGIKLLAQIPIVESVMESGENGEPAALKDGPVYEAFSSIAMRL